MIGEVFRDQGQCQFVYEIGEGASWIGKLDLVSALFREGEVVRV